MKILQINSVYGVGSTGRIVKDISDLLIEKGHKSYIAYGCGTVCAKNIYRMESRFYQKINILKTRMFGKHGFYNKIATYKLIRWIDTVNPDVIHLHNIHGHYINIEILFKYLKKIDKPIVWTLHDCWAFTGHCSHFDFVQCKKWKKGCNNCPQRREYPDSWFFDRSRISWNKKKQIFTNMKDITIVAPSLWLAERIRESFLSVFSINVIHNGVDLEVYKPTESDFRIANKLEDKIVILGVSSIWNEKKGLNIFTQLSQTLDSRYQVVLVGLSEEQLKSMPDEILKIRATTDMKKLVEIYSAADLFLNPSQEETMGLVTVEALASGTPVVVSNFTAVPEIVNDKCGCIVDEYSAKAFADLIEPARSLLTENCRKRAREYDSKIKYNQYVCVYEDVVIEKDT